MLSSLLLILSVKTANADVQTGDVLHFVKSVPLTEHGYKVSRQSGVNPARIVWQRPSDSAELLLSVYELEGQEVDHQFWVSVIGASTAPGKKSLLSGHAVVGEGAFNSSQVPAVHWRLGELLVSAKMRYRVGGSRGKWTHLSDDSVTDALLVEGVARAVIGCLTGRDAKKGADRAINGATVECYDGPAGFPCLDLEGWANARRLVLRRNHVSGIAALDSRVGHVVFPLGAASAKVGNKLQTLREPIFAVNGKWFVDEQFLATLN